MTNVFREKNLRCFEWTVQTPACGSSFVSDIFLLQDRKCIIEFFTGFRGGVLTNNARLFFKSNGELLTPVTITVRVICNSDTIATRTELIRSSNQELWNHTHPILETVLTFEIIIHTDSSKDACKTSSKQSLCVESLSSDLGKLLENQEHFDIVLKCGEQFFPAHCNILSARSHVFSEMFRNQTPANEKRTVSIEDMEPIFLYYFLRYIYTDIIEAAYLDTVIDLYQVAQKYKVHSLKQKCSSLIQDYLSEDTICTVLLLADQYCDQELLEAAVAFAATIENFLTSKQWDVFSEQRPQLAVNVYKKYFKK